MTAIETPVPPNYRDLLDADVWDFIDQTNDLFPPEAAKLSIADQRVVYDAMAASFHAPLPAGISVEDVTLPAAFKSVRCRIYTPATLRSGTTLLYLHGGGFIFGDLDSHGDICADIASSTAFRAVSVGYRLAPEHVHPAALDDAIAAFDWVAATGDAVVLVGESAGGNLAAAAAAHRRLAPNLFGQLLIYPGLGGDQTRGSYVEHGNAPLLATADLDEYVKLRAGGWFDPADANLFPLRADDFSSLPPTVVVTAQCDPLADDGPIYTQSIREAGGTARCREEPRLTHSFMRARHITRRGREAFEAIVEDLVTLAA